MAVIVLVAALPLFYFAMGTYQLYGYGMGRPTTATVVDCHAQRSWRRSGVFHVLSTRQCNATWDIGGESHTGSINGPRGGFDVGTAVNARVLGGTAFTIAGAGWQFFSGVLAVALVPISLLLFWVLFWVFGKFLQHVVLKGRSRG